MWIIFMSVSIWTISSTDFGFPPYFPALVWISEAQRRSLQTDINNSHLVLNTGCQPKSKFLLCAYYENVYVADRLHYLCCSSRLCVCAMWRKSCNEFIVESFHFMFSLLYFMSEYSESFIDTFPSPAVICSTKRWCTLLRRYIKLLTDA